MNRIAQYSILSFALIIVFYFLAYLPFSSEYGLIDNRINEARQELLDFHATAEQFPEFLASRQQLAGEESHLTSRLYAKNDIIKLFDRIRHDAENLDLRVTEISPPVEELLRLNATPNNLQAEFLNISISIEGNFLQLGRYVQGLEQAGFFRGINRSEFISTNDPARGTSLRVEFRALLGNERPEGVTS
ncbi:MAG TPA: hypothetical protein PLF13_05515 [candidate division Zixibacteria bacterium]|nr:hypothetical protein [candidate division Zixibacteria bacterium]